MSISHRIRAASVECEVAVAFPLISAAAVVALVPLRDYVLDDAYITYRYARNIVLGRGFVYNPGEHILGTTTPGYTLLLAGLNRISSLDFPILSWLCGIAFTAGAGILSYALLKSWLRPEVALAGALLLVTNPILTAAVGMETSLYVFLLEIAAYLTYVRIKPLGVGTAIGLAILVRPDAGLAYLFPFMAWGVGRLKTKDLVLVASMSALVVLPWLLFSLAYFGSPIPHTLEAKRVDYAGTPTDFLRGLIIYPRLYFHFNPLFALVVPLCLLGGWRVFQQKPAVALGILGWCALYLGSFQILGLPNLYIWYWSPLQLGMVILMASGIDTLADWRQRGPVAQFAGLVTSVALIICLTATNLAAGYWALDWNPRFYVYRAVAEYLRQSSRPDDLVASPEIGVIGYYSDRPVLDLFGLVSPTVTRVGAGMALVAVQPTYSINVSLSGYKEVEVFPVPARGQM
ncbi:MAG TPA: glycosyltransferase family 87 protein, partial [Chloroflexota bacterium]|nr:glycosyltransferase family 87 protein [Chloroflexota bacterium]